MTEIGLKIGSAIYTQWEKVEIFRTMEALCGSFTLELVDSQPGQKPAHQIQPGDGCALSIDGTVIMTGWVDDVMPEYDKSSHKVVIKGRDKTCDLVDCSAIHGSGNWQGASLMQIAQDLCAPFKIGVRADVDVSRARFNEQIQIGETVFEALERLARLYGVVLMSDFLGNVLFTRAGSAGVQASLELGKTIEKAQGQFSARQRFSKYIVLGQLATGAPIDPESAALPHGEATDPGVTRYRPKIILDQFADVDATYYQQRALWEAANRSGRARRATFTVPKFHDANKRLWNVNRMVPVEDKWLGIKESLLVIGAKFMVDDKGTRSEITVTRKSAYEMAPISPAQQLGFDQVVVGPH